MRFYTGFQNLQQFMLHYIVVANGLTTFIENGGDGTPAALPRMDQLTCLPMQVWLGLVEVDPTHRLDISASSVSHTFSFWVEFLAAY